MIAILYCPTCRKTIEGYGAPVSDMFAKIVERYMVYRRLYYTLDDSGTKQIVRFMEQKRLVVSTDIENNYIAITPKGVRCYEGEGGCLCSVCFYPEKHAKND